MTDKLKMDAINALPHPLYARFCGGDEWPVHDIDVQTGLMRIDVVGRLQIKHFADVTDLKDADGDQHDADDFWLDEDIS